MGSLPQERVDASGGRAGEALLEAGGAGLGLGRPIFTSASIAMTSRSCGSRLTRPVVKAVLGFYANSEAADRGPPARLSEPFPT